MRSECSFLRFTNGGNLKVLFAIYFYFIDKSVAHFSCLQVFFFLVIKGRKKEREFPMPVSARLFLHVAKYR